MTSILMVYVPFSSANSKSLATQPTAPLLGHPVPS